jgi:hypothetical protein
MGDVGVSPDEPRSEPVPGEQTDDKDAERVIRHRIVGHKAALELADQLDRPEALAQHVEETEHRLAEDEDILEEIVPDDPDED